MSRKMYGGADLQNQKIINLADPTANTDGANKQYVDNVARGLYWKAPVIAASTGNVSLSAPGSSLDGVTLTNPSRILLKNQTAGAENGIYDWTGASTPLTRSTDADTGTELNPGTAVTVTQGTVNGDKVYLIVSDSAVTIGTTATTWGALGGGATYTASLGVQLVGSDFRGVAKSGGGLLIDANGFYVDTSTIVRKISGAMGNGSLTTIDITHGLNNLDPQVSVRIASTGEEVTVDVQATDANTVRFTFPSAPASGFFRYTIQG